MRTAIFALTLGTILCPAALFSQTMLLGVESPRVAPAPPPSQRVKESEVSARVRKLVANLFPILPDSEIRTTSRFDDLVYGSPMAAARLLSDVKKIYGVEVPSSFVETSHTVGDLISYVERRAQIKHGRSLERPSEPIDRGRLP